MMIRKVIFWIHLLSGSVAGVVILMMSVTGVILTFQSQMVAFDNRSYSTVEPPLPGAVRLDMDTIVNRANASEPEDEVTSVTVRPNPKAAYVVNFGRTKTVFVDPYTGEVRGEGNTRLRDILRSVMYWHRWFGAEGDNRDIAMAITGAGNLAFCLLTITGIFIWWPRKHKLTTFKTNMIPKFKIHGKARDFNWHHTAGFWFLPVLFLISLSGIYISYSWAGDLVYTLTGTERPPAQAPPPRGATWETPRIPLESFITVAKEQVPEWAYIKLDLPKTGAKTAILSISESDSRIPLTRSTLKLKTENAAVVEWVPFSGLNLGNRITTWLRWIHTGEAGGWIGQLIAGLATTAALVLGWTGLSLSYRRLSQYLKRRRTSLTNENASQN